MQCHLTLLLPLVDDCNCTQAVSFISPDVILCGCLGFKHQLTNCFLQAVQYLNFFGIAIGFFRLHRASIEDQHRNFTVRLMQPGSLFQRWRLVCFQNSTAFLTICNSLLYILHTHTIWKRSVEKIRNVMGHWVGLPIFIVFSGGRVWSNNEQRHRQAWSKMG